DANEEWIQQERAVQQRIVLQTDVPTRVEEPLVVLVVVVKIVLAAEEYLDRRAVGRLLAIPVRFDPRDVVEAAEAARDVAGIQWPAFECRDDPDHVLGPARRDHNDLQLLR